MSWVNTVLAAAERHGLTRAQLLAHAGLQLDQLNYDRWPIDDITRLWRAAAELTQDAGFGLKAGSLVGPASFNVVSFIFQSSPTLREAITLAQQFQRLISDGGRFQLIAGDTHSWLIYHPQQGDLAFSPHQIEAVLAAVVSFSRWVSTHAIIPARVQFGLTDRAFARRLQSHGLSYSDVVDGVRKEAACTAVARTDRAFMDIAHSLGFSEASAFNRAFKRWCGQAPGEWRLARGMPDSPA